MKKVFVSFDTDKSGFIDANELKEVSKELGKELDAAELEECLKDLDQNKDGKISYEEFAAWWTSGRQGLTGIMRNLLGYKLTALKFLDSISGTLKDTIAEAATQKVDISTNSLSININKVEHAGFSIYLKGLLLTEEVKNDYNTIKGIHKFSEEPEGEQGYINIVFDVVGGSPHEVIDKINKVLEDPML